MNTPETPAAAEPEAAAPQAAAQAPVAPAKPPELKPCILETRNFLDHTGLRIEQFVLIDGEWPEGLPPFMAHAVVKLKVASPVPGEAPGIRRMPIQVPLEKATTIQEAYAQAPEAIQADADTLVEQHEKAMKDQVASHAALKAQAGPGRKKIIGSELADAKSIIAP